MGHFEVVEDEITAALVRETLRTARTIFVKKLSNNDRDWAQRKNKHQAGVYVPPIDRDSGFFPPLSAKARNDASAREIREAWFQTDWPQLEIKRTSRLVHYTSKGPETHLTGVPKEAFAGLSPASWLVMARSEDDREPRFNCLTIDSNSDEADILVDALELKANFVSGILNPPSIIALERDRIMGFADQVASAWLAGTIAQFARESATMPRTADLAARARSMFLDECKLASLNPFAMERPGDALLRISREIEWQVFRDFQRRERAVALVRAVLGDDAAQIDSKGLARRLVNSVDEIDRLMLSASQQRKSRAGYSFEHQIEAMLIAGSIPFAKQVIMDARKRPDFILPSRSHLERKLEGATRGLILSAKTTLRERWTQVQHEMGGSDLFLATVDASIAANAIQDMASMRIRLVVPETLKQSRDTEYVRHDNVLDFAAFFHVELGHRRMPLWLGSQMTRHS